MRKYKLHSYRVLNLDCDTMSVVVNKDKYYNTIRKTKNDKFNWWQSTTELNNMIEFYYEYSRKENTDN